MGLKSEVDQNWLAAVQSGNIRYQTLPLGAAIPIANDAAWDQLYAAAASPAVPHWLCGFAFSIATNTVLAEVVMLIDVGYGGADAAAGAPTNILIVGWPIGLTAVAVALGPHMHQNQMLPYPIRIPAGVVSPGSRMVARIASSVPAGVALTAFRVILATAVGS